MNPLKTNDLPENITIEEGAAIRLAVEEAERHSGAEVVALALASADDYPVASWKGAAVCGFAAAIGGAVMAPLPALGLARASWMLLLVALGFVVGALSVVVIPPWRRWLCGHRLLERRLEQRAREAFLVYQVFKTRDRTGILVAVSGFERRVAVIADEGIHAVVPEGTWQKLANETAAIVRTSGPGAGLLAAVRQAGEILATHGLARRSDDQNELPDGVRGEFR
ncbi:MAG: hypothetical protein ABI639_07620 [Thermoanaerobaculia bacterium]